MKCKNCNFEHHERKEICDACKKMQAQGRWEWEIDNGQRICRCPRCGFGNILSSYAYSNPYRFCPSCGTRMIDEEERHDHD